MEGDAVGMVLGLSLTSDDVVWVLVDDADGTVADHDEAEFNADAEIAGAAARGAHAIATAGGFDVERIRLVWSDDVARDGLRLLSRLGALGFDNAEAVPLKCAGAVMVDPDMEPGLALAYGAALAEVSLLEAITVPISTRAKPRRIRRGRMAMAVLGAAAAATVGGLLLTSGSVPRVEQTAVAAEQQAVADPGWVAVSAPSDSAAHTVRKVVEALAADTPVFEAPEPAQPEPAAATGPQAESVAAVAAPVGVPHLPAGVPEAAEPVVIPPPAPLVAAPVALPAEVPAPESVPTGQPHLPVDQPAPGPPTDMTDPANLFTGLP